MNSLEDEQEATHGLHSLERSETHGLGSLEWPELAEQPCHHEPKEPEPCEGLAPSAGSPRQLVRTTAPIAVGLVVLAALVVECLRACGGGHAARRGAAGSARQIPAVRSGSHKTAAKQARKSDRARRRTHPPRIAGVIERNSFGRGAALDGAPEPAKRYLPPPARIAATNARAQSEFGFERQPPVDVDR
jgi:hypothetical protein